MCMKIHNTKIESIFHTCALSFFSTWQQGQQDSVSWKLLLTEPKLPPSWSRNNLGGSREAQMIRTLPAPPVGPWSGYGALWWTWHLLLAPVQPRPQSHPQTLLVQNVALELGRHLWQQGTAYFFTQPLHSIPIFGFTPMTQMQSKWQEMNQGVQNWMHELELLADQNLIHCESCQHLCMHA